jgi:hypothetical protein
MSGGRFSIFNLQSSPARAGVSLLEVLISTFVLAIGLLGLGALIPAGNFAVSETTRADRCGCAGRAALRDAKVMRIADYMLWSPKPADSTTAQAPVVIDPLGVGAGFGGTLGGLQRITLNLPAAALARFRCSDDWVFDEGTDSTLRPQAMNIDGYYTWLATVTPAATELAAPMPQKRQFTVSAAVVYKRVLQSGASTEYPRTATFDTGGGIGGGNVTLSGAPPDDTPLRENEWVLLSDGATQCHWYRIVAAGQSPQTQITLAGPDWNTGLSPTATMIYVGRVLGVYTTTIDLDRDPFWTPPEYW